MEVTDLRELAVIGDTIQCKVQNPFPQTLQVILETVGSVEFANQLIMAGRWEIVRD
jgi:hypothetical protein